ncbi:hypothetical protein ACLOJK_034708 [Asimina triloba]
MGGSHGYHHCRQRARRHFRPPPSAEAVDRPSPPPLPSPSTMPDAVESRRPKPPSKPPSTAGETHHRRAVLAPIRAIHHEEDDAHIPNLLRAQADVDHRGHTRRVFLARHQQIQLNPAPIMAHFRSKPSHPLIHIFMDHFIDFDPKMDQHRNDVRRFLLKPISPSIFFKSLLPFSRHQRGLDQWIQAVHRSVHRRPPLSPPSDAPTADVAARTRLRLPTSLPTRSPPPLPTARIHRLHPCRLRRPSTATIAWPELAAKHRPPTM